jgi:hypothetical protein
MYESARIVVLFDVAGYRMIRGTDQTCRVSNPRWIVDHERSL